MEKQIGCKDLKKIVEKFTNVVDLSTRCRDRNIVDARYIYYQLCKNHKDVIGYPSTLKIGSYVDRDHSSVLHGYSEFKKCYGTSKFSYNGVYEKCEDDLIDLIDDVNIKFDKKNSIKRFKDKYITKHLKMSNKYRETIDKLRRKLNAYRHNNFINQLVDLSPEDLKEAEEKFKVFLKVKQSMKR